MVEGGPLGKRKKRVGYSKRGRNESITDRRKRDGIERCVACVSFP
jgi:hypothetical protein